MLDCFIDTIGLSYCEGETAPVSGLYLNTLPGISIESIDHIANSEQISYKGVWKDVQVNALTQFRTEILSELNQCFKLNKTCDYDELICDNTELLYQPLRYLLGVWLMVFRQQSTRLNYFTTIALEDAEKMQVFFRGEYDASLKQSIKLFDTTGCCMVCDPTPKRVVYLP